LVPVPESPFDVLRGESPESLCKVPDLPEDLQKNPRFVAWHSTEKAIAMEREEFMDRLRYKTMTDRQREGLWYKACKKQPPPLYATPKPVTELNKDVFGVRIPELGTPTYETKKKVAPRWTGPVLRAIQRTGKVNEALRAAHVDEHDYFLWKGKDPDFAKAVQRSWVEASSLIEGKLFELATDGEEQAVYLKGKKVGSDRRVSVPAAKLLLEGMLPERYVEPAALAEGKAASGSGNGLTMNITINALGGNLPANFPAALRVKAISEREREELPRLECEREEPEIPEGTPEQPPSRKLPPAGGGED
jgi:hypothetical protein